MDLPKRKRNRLNGFDYSSNGAYFITICTDNRKQILSRIVGAIHESPATVLTFYGQIVKKYIQKLPERFGIRIDTYVIMPNHIHLLVVIDNPDYIRAIHESPLRNESDDLRAIRESPLRNESDDLRAIRESPLRNESDDLQAIRESPLRGRSVISNIIGYLKMNASRDIHAAGFSGKIWQRSFHDHIIRTQKDYNKIFEYICCNPQLWLDDCFYTEE